MVIRESVEPLLEEYRPPGITSLKFSKLSLGTVAPKIEGLNPHHYFISLFIFHFYPSKNYCICFCSFPVKVNYYLFVT